MTKKINIPNVGIADVSDFQPDTEEERLILDFEKQAEDDIEKRKNTINIHFRWSEFELKRAKKIAAQLGIPYQTYIKMTLKQAMDSAEKKYN